MGARLKYNGMLARSNDDLEDLRSMHRAEAARTGNTDAAKEIVRNVTLHFLGRRALHAAEIRFLVAGCNAIVNGADANAALGLRHKRSGAPKSRAVQRLAGEIACAVAEEAAKVVRARRAATTTKVRGDTPLDTAVATVAKRFHKSESTVRKAYKTYWARVRRLG